MKIQTAPTKQGTPPSLLRRSFEGRKQLRPSRGGGSFRINLHEFFDGLWGIFRYLIFNFAPNNKGRIVQVSGKTVDLSQKVTINHYGAGLYEVCAAIEEFAQKFPSEGRTLKEIVLKRTSQAMLPKYRRWGDLGYSLEWNTLGPFIRANFPKHSDARKHAHDFLETRGDKWTRNGLHNLNKKEKPNAETNGCMMFGPSAGLGPHDVGVPDDDKLGGLDSRES